VVVVVAGAGEISSHHDTRAPFLDYSACKIPSIFMYEFSLMENRIKNTCKQQVLFSCNFRWKQTILYASIATHMVSFVIIIIFESVISIRMASMLR
jgi:hypothetical protein